MSPILAAAQARVGVRASRIASSSFENQQHYNSHNTDTGQMRALGMTAPSARWTESRGGPELGSLRVEPVEVTLAERSHGSWATK